MGGVQTGVISEGSFVTIDITSKAIIVVSLDPPGESPVSLLIVSLKRSMVTNVFSGLSFHN